MANGTSVTNNFNGMIGADSATTLFTGGTGSGTGNGGNATTNRQGNIYTPLGAALTVNDTAVGGLAAGTGNGGNAAVTTNGNIVSTSHLLSSISFTATAVAGIGAKDGNAAATMNGNIITYNNATATNVTLDAAATYGTLEAPGGIGAAFGTKSATLNGNIVTGNVNSVTLEADATYANTTATLNGNIVSTKATDTGTITVEATGQKIAINGNIFTLGKQNVNLTLNEVGPTYSASVAGNIFNGTGTNILTLTDNQNPLAASLDTVSINMGAHTFTFDGQSNIINNFAAVALTGNLNGTLIGTPGNDTLDASGFTTTGTVIFQGNGGTDTLKADPTLGALNVAQFAGSDWQYAITPNANQPFIDPTNVSTIPANIISPNAIIPATNTTLTGPFERIKFNGPANVSDVNDDGFGDLVYQNGTTGNIQVNLITAGNTIGPAINIANTGTKVIGTGQFTPDTNRNAGILIQDNTSGALSVITGVAGVPVTTALSGALVTPTTFTGWNAITAGDFNGDAASDVLLQNGTSGAVEIAFLNTKAGEPIGQVDAIKSVSSPGTNWNVISSGDFNADGNSDILWQNSMTGAVDISLMTGSSGSAVSIGTDPVGFTAVGTGDFNGDGKSDVVFGNQAGNQAQIWFMNGSTVNSTLTVTGPGAGYKLLGAEDINKDGFSDLLWQNTAGDVMAQAMTTGGALLGPIADLGTNAGAFRLVASTGGG